MNPIADRQDILINAGDLNEQVLEAAAKADGGGFAPEVTTGTADITAWDQSSGATGQRMLEMPVEENTIAEQLVGAGNDEADREQRVAAALDELSK